MANISNKELIKKAKSSAHEKQLTEEAVIGEVGSAIVTTKGKVYTGLNLSAACGLGFCGEVSAILSMIKGGESQIKKIVALSSDGKIMPPCGRCRELMFQVNRKNLNAEIILSEKKITRLSKLLPNRWQELWE